MVSDILVESGTQYPFSVDSADPARNCWLNY
jgi:hypothetical protein